MKKTLRIMGLCALAALALVGCKKEQKNTVTFKATLPQPACEAKTHIGSGNWLMWNAGDAIKVYTADKTEASSATFTTTDGDQTTADFSGTLAESELYYAFYPTTGVELNADGKFMLPVSATQTFVESNFTTNAFPMCATSTDGTFNFHSPYGILGIPMKGNATIGSIVLTDTTGMQLAGYYTMDATDTTFVGTSAAITLNFGTGVTLNTTTPTTAYFIVPAGVFQSGFNAAVRGIDGSTIFNLGTIQPNTILKESIHMMPETTVNATTPTGLTNALTLEALTDGTVVVNNPQSGMQYSLNGGAKAPVTSDAINVSASDKVAFYGNGTSINNYDGTTIAGGTAQVKAYGNIMSLIDETGYATLTTLPNQDNVFKGLFFGNATLTDASGLLLPATALTNSCYNMMFYNCSTLTAAPALPATTLADKCYQNMFYGCTALTTAPELPATTLAEDCYNSMFQSSGLTAAPALPATTLATRCYNAMFRSCNNLATAPSLPAAVLPEGCYMHMFRQSGLVTVPANMMASATTMGGHCCESMFRECPNLTNAPTIAATTVSDYSLNAMFYHSANVATADFTLPATTLADHCYYNMFNGCTALTTAPELPATTLAESCYQNMFKLCSSLTTAPVLPATTLTNSCYAEMFNGCTSLNNITCLATAGINENYSTTDWVNSVASTGTFNRASGVTWPEGANGIPSGWTLVPPAVPTLDLATVTTATTVEDGYTVTGTLGANVKISIADGATVTLDGVTINGENDDSYQWAGINCLGDATIILSGTNTVKGFQRKYPGIHVPVDKTLTIQGSGSLTASSNGQGCGIGGGYQIACGNIVIAGGTITATGGTAAAGIGGGGGTAGCGNISITGGNITANGGVGAAGIGGGLGGSCGNISITGGTITANGGSNAAGIGGGSNGGNGSSCGNISITNGVTSVTATKGISAKYSIGRGNNGSCGTVTIGGTIYWENNAAVGDGATYLTQSPLVYEP